MFTASSPELNNLNLFQKRNIQFKTEQSKTNGTLRHLESNDSNLKKREHLPYYFTSVPDLTFRVTQPNNNSNSEAGSDCKRFNSQQANRTKASLFSLGVKNFKNLRSQNNTGSVPNLFNEFANNPNCYNIQRSKLSIEYPNNLSQQRSNSINMLESQAQRHLFSYSNKIDESPELVPNKSSEFISSVNANSTMSSKANIYSPSNQNIFIQQQQQQQQHQHQQQQQHVIYANLNSFQANNVSSNSSIKPAHEYLSKVIEPLNKSVINQMHNSNSNAKQILSSLNNIPTIQEVSQQRETEFKNTNDKKTEFSNDKLSMDKKNKIESSNITKNSRIIVFDKSFEDQDFTREFELLPRMNPTAKFTTASLSENILKNRFRDILPYEENRFEICNTLNNFD